MPLPYSQTANQTNDTTSFLNSNFSNDSTFIGTLQDHRKN
jgi:hypothetical protein